MGFFRFGLGPVQRYEKKNLKSGFNACFPFKGELFRRALFLDSVSGRSRKMIKKFLGIFLFFFFLLSETKKKFFFPENFK